MNPALLFLVVFTSNILGSFNDPFEFDGNYGDEANPVREYVFEQVVSKEAINSNLTDFQIIELMRVENPSNKEIQQYRQQLVEEGTQEDLAHGPTLGELIPASLVDRLSKKQFELAADGFTPDDLQSMLYFLNRYQDEKIFTFLRHNPSELLSLDKILRDKASREGRSFDLPILSSTEPLEGASALELKTNLLDTLFTQETLKVAKPKDTLDEAIENLDPGFLKKYLGPDAENADLMTFTTPAGQVFFYWLYQSLNLHLIAQDKAMIPQINKVKEIFANTLGNPLVRAKEFKDKLMAANASVVFTQESDAIVPKLLTEDGLFLPIDQQNPADGTLVFLRADIWEPTYQIIPIENYDGYAKGRLNVILATLKETGEQFLLASSHGNSTRAEDGRLQIDKIMEKFHQLAQSNKDLQLLIGIDANTKTEQDVALLRAQLDSLNLTATSVGPTTVKKRMVTAQHSKAGRFAVDEEDYLILLKPDHGALYQLTNPTVGFKEETPDPTIPLPNTDNPSDHYPIGATLVPIH